MAVERLRFSESSRFLLALAALPLIFLPKINLVQIGEESAGVRIDDFVILGILGAILLLYCAKGAVLSRIERLFYCFFLAGCFSVVLNWIFYLVGILNAAANPLYVARMLEYFAFYYVGFYLAAWMRLTNIVLALFILNAFVVGLQALGLVGGFTIAGYVQNVASAPPGITAGHWELGFMISCILGLLLFRYSSVSSRFVTREGLSFLPLSRLLPLFWLFLGVCLLALMGSRSGLLSLFVVVVVRFFVSAQHKVFALLGLSFGLVATGFVLLQFSELAALKRSEHLFSANNMQLAWQVWQNTDPDAGTLSEAYSDLELIPDEAHDLSWAIRIHKWSYATKYYLYHPECYLLGLGPGYCGTALDGGFLRLLVENGVVGLSLFLYFLWTLSRDSLALQAIVLILLINMLFLDTYLAYKAMSLFYLIAGGINRLLSLSDEERSSKTRSEQFRLLGVFGQ